MPISIRDLPRDHFDQAIYASVYQKHATDNSKCVGEDNAKLLWGKMQFV